VKGRGVGWEREERERMVRFEREVRRVVVRWWRLRVVV